MSISCGLTLASTMSLLSVGYDIYNRFTYGYNTTRRRNFQSNHRSANGCQNFSPRQHVARSTAALTEILQLGLDLTQFSNDLVQALGL